jgi:hypothetical protein
VSEPIMTGQLYPCCGGEGCRFTVTTGSLPKTYNIVLVSPYKDGVIVDEVTDLDEDKVFTWLEGRADY